MSASKLRNFGLAMLVVIGSASVARAQLDDINSPFYGPENDLQWFEPVDLDLDGRGLRDRAGFFARYEKLYWAPTGERVEVGDPHTVQRMFRIWSAPALDPDLGVPIQPVLLTNSIQNAIPRADFHFGDRYEIGYWGENNNGWLISVLDGPDSHQNFDMGLNGGSQTGQGGLASPYGDVFVSFRTAIGTLAGFLDVDSGQLEGILSGDSDGDGILDGDGFTDDVNNNGTHGAVGVDLLPPPNEPDSIIIGQDPDYGDLVTLTTAFGTVNLRNNTKVNGVEIMRMHRLDNSHYQVSHQHNQFDIFYGARYLQIDDQFVFSGDGGLVLGESMWDTQIVNNIVGPQVGFQYNRHHGRWVFDSQGRFMLGYNVQNWDQVGFIGEDLIPGRDNHPLYARAKSFSYGKMEDALTPVGELRANLSYNLTDSVALKLGYTGTFVNNISRAANHVDYVFYDEAGKVMGFRDAGNEQMMVNGINFGIEITQ
jgi:hypothetical protein